MVVHVEPNSARSIIAVLSFVGIAGSKYSSLSLKVSTRICAISSVSTVLSPTYKLGSGYEILAPVQVVVGVLLEASLRNI